MGQITSGMWKIRHHSMDKEQLEKPAEPWEFRPCQLAKTHYHDWRSYSKPIIGLIYIMILFVWGEETLPTENAIYGSHLSTDFKKGTRLTQEGDNIIIADGIPSKEFGDINQMVIIDGARELTIVRKRYIKNYSTRNFVEILY